MGLGEQPASCSSPSSDDEEIVAFLLGLLQLSQQKLPTLH